MFDTLILGGQLIDGTGGPSVKSDLGIKGDRIQATGNLAAASAARIIDATGLTLCPGFIDTELIQDLPDEQKKYYKNQVILKSKKVSNFKIHQKNCESYLNIINCRWKLFH